MRRVGLEPTHPSGQQVLSLSRLPIPSPPRKITVLSLLRQKPEPDCLRERLSRSGVACGHSSFGPLRFASGHTVVIRVEIEPVDAVITVGQPIKVVGQFSVQPG